MAESKPIESDLSEWPRLMLDIFKRFLDAHGYVLNDVIDTEGVIALFFVSSEAKVRICIDDQLGGANVYFGALSTPNTMEDFIGDREVWILIRELGLPPDADVVDPPGYEDFSFEEQMRYDLEFLESNYTAIVNELHRRLSEEGTRRQ